jgi:hypothetical protein
MLRAEDPGVHYEAVGVIGNLVHSSQNIKRRVLEEGALQPVINLLSSSCPESQREAALLLGQFATTQVQPGEEGPGEEPLEHRRLGQTAARPATAAGGQAAGWWLAAAGTSTVAATLLASVRHSHAARCSFFMSL